MDLFTVVLLVGFAWMTVLWLSEKNKNLDLPDRTEEEDALISYGRDLLAEHQNLAGGLHELREIENRTLQRMEAAARREKPS